MHQNDPLHRKHMDELPAAEYGWAWLGEIGRFYGADKGDLIQLPKLGGIATAWKGADITCLFVLLRDPYNWTDIHCVDVMGGPGIGLGMQLHECDEEAKESGDEWIKALKSRRDVDTIDVNRSESGAAICSAWRGRRLIGYYVQFQDCAGWTHLFCQELHSTQVNPSP